MSWNGSDDGDRVETTRATGRATNIMRGAVAGGLVMAVVLAGLFFLLSGGKDECGPPDRSASGRRASRIVETKPVEVGPRQPSEAPNETPPSVVDPDFQANYPRRPGHLPLPGGTVVTFRPPAPGCTAEVFTVGGLYLCDSEGNFTKYEPPMLFDNRFENTLESLASDRQLILSNRAKDFSKEEISKYLTAPVVIEETDTPDIIQRKTATAAMKEEIIAYIKDGGTYRQYIDELHHQIGTERALHREAMREVVALLSEGDVEGARACREEMDKFFDGQGLRRLKMPDAWQRKLDGPPDPDDE